MMGCPALAAPRTASAICTAACTWSGAALPLASNPTHTMPLQPRMTFSPAA